MNKYGIVKLTVPIYNVEVEVFSDIEKAKPYYEGQGIVVDNDKETLAYVTKTVDNKGFTRFLLFAPSHYTLDTDHYLIHEVLHLSFDILEYIGFVPQSETDEPVAYLATYLLVLLKQKYYKLKFKK